MPKDLTNVAVIIFRYRKNAIARINMFFKLKTNLEKD